jgi:hypothetical protein
MVNTVGDIIASWPAPRFPDEDGGERNAKAIAAALNGAHAQGANDKDLGKHLGTYLGMSGIDAEDVAHIRAMLAPRTPAACARVANQPPAHWTGPSRWDRHPQTAEEWDAHKDPVGGKVEKAIRRINFAGDMTDPDAPDQMAIVHRWDLTTLMHELVFKRAAFDSHKETIEQLRALVENAARLQAAIESIPPHLNWLIGKGKTRPDEPPHAVQLLEDLKVVAQTEGDDLCAAIRDAIASLPHPSTSQELGR